MTDLIALAEIPDGEAKRIRSPKGELVVVRTGVNAVAYRNICPHLMTPLNLSDDELVADDGVHLMCDTHGALFRITDGFCTTGPCEGDSLDEVKVIVEDGLVKIA